MKSERPTRYRCAAHSTWAYSHREMAAHVEVYHRNAPAAEWETWQHCAACDTWMNTADPQHAPGCTSRRAPSGSMWLGVGIFALIAAVLLLIRAFLGGIQ